MRLDRLVGSSGPTAVFAEGASPTTLSALGGLSTEISSSKDAQPSLEASWVAPSEAEKALEAHSRESEVITVGLF